MPKEAKPGTANVEPIVKLLANVEDLATGKAYNKYRIRKVGGERATCLVERSKVADARSLADDLLDRNADLPTDAKARTELLAKIIATEPRALEARAAKVGWVDGHHGFVRHTAVAGVTGGKRKLLPPLWVEGARHRTRVKGNLADWNKKLGGAIRWSSRLQLVAAATFAAPLVRLINLQPFAIVIFDRSSVGKSTAVLVAGSIVGLGGKETIPNWNMSAKSFQETASRFNDHVLLVDETGAADQPKDKVYDLMRRVTYTYAEGTDAQRHSKSGFATSKAQADAKGILITTSEHSLDAMAAMAGKVRDAGEVARAFNLPATHSGNATIFDRWPKGLKEGDRAAWTEKKFASVRTGCAQHYGTAFKNYIENLVNIDKGNLVASVEAAMAEFHQALGPVSVERAVQHAARNFAVVYAGGVLAIEAGLMPVIRSRLLQSIVGCFNDGLACISSPVVDEKEALSQLITGLENADIQEKSALLGEKESDGFWRDDEGRSVFAIKPAVFNGWFSSDAHRQVALRWLDAQSLLMLRDDKALPTGHVTTEHVVTFEKVTNRDGKRKQGRWIRFYDPRSAVKDG